MNALTVSPEDKVKENNESNRDQNPNDPVHVFPAAHLHFDVLGGLFHHHSLLLQRFTLIPRILKVLATNQGLLKIIHDDCLGLLQTLPQLSHFRAIVGVIVPLGHKLDDFVLVLSESCLSARGLEGHVELFIAVRVATC